MEQLSAEGMEALPEMVGVLINEAMQIERAKHIHATPNERKEDRSGHSNGFKPKTVKTRMGEITFDVPQVREGSFYPGVLEKGGLLHSGVCFLEKPIHHTGLSLVWMTPAAVEFCLAMGWEVHGLEWYRLNRLQGGEEFWVKNLAIMILAMLALCRHKEELKNHVYSYIPERSSIPAPHLRSPVSITIHPAGVSLFRGPDQGLPWVKQLKRSLYGYNSLFSFS